MQSQQSQKTFQTLVLHLQRPINCLTDQDRNTRKGGLVTIANQINSLNDPSLIVRIFTETNLQQYLVKRTLWDKIQDNREKTLNIISKFSAKVKSQYIKSDLLKPFIEELIKRINSNPFPQTSEDLRLQTIKLLEKYLNAYPDCFNWYISEICNALSKTLMDPFAEIKHASNSLINLLCKKFKDKIGQHSLLIIKSLALNLSHQHSKVRKNTLITAGQLLITHNAGTHFQQIQVNIKASLGDKSADVRKQAIICVSKMLKGFGPKYMKMHEATLVSHLLAGLSDQNQGVVAQSINQLQLCGQAIQQMQTGQKNENVMEQQK